jgi:hypothetical protein
MDGNIISHHKATPASNINVVPGRVTATIRSTRTTLIERDGIDQFLHFKNGSDWWAIEKVTGPEPVQRLYGAQLACDFFEFIWSGSGDEPIPGMLANVFQSMPVEKTAVELGFIDQVQRFAYTSAIVSKMGGHA